MTPMTPMTPAQIATLNRDYEAELARRKAILEADPDARDGRGDRITDSTHIVTHDVAMSWGLDVVREDDLSGILYRNSNGELVYGWESGGFSEEM